MNVRKLLNRVLQPRGYQVVKLSNSEAAFFFRPGADVEIGNKVISSRLAPKRKHVWLVAAPKSGSTWFTTLLTGVLQWPVVPLVNGHGRREQEIDVRAALRHPNCNIFSPQQHCRASQPTLDFINECRVTPIVQTRDIFDSVVSFRDHLLGDSVIVPMAFADGQFAKLSEERQYEFVIEMVVPWYFNFYASWFREAEIAPNRYLFVSYEDLVGDPVATLNETLRFIKETRPNAHIRETVERANGMNTRRNKGVAGRGQDLLPAHKAKIRKFREYYPDMDFSRIGL